MPRALLLFLIAVLPLTSPARAFSRADRATPYIVVLDPGHGGGDPGAADVTQTLVEKILTLQVAKLAAADLQRVGYRVFLTRSRDQGVNTPPRDLNHDGVIDHADEFMARNLFANRHHADVFVSIHFDASLSQETRGTHGYFCPARPFWRQSDRLALMVTQGLAASLRHAGYRSTDDGVETDVADVVPQMRADYPWFLVLGPSRRHFVTGTAMPGALIETLYLTSPRDVAALHHAAILQALGQGYADGIRAYFGGSVRR